MAAWRNGHDTLSYDELVEKHGYTRQQWAEWIWESVEELGYHFLIGSSTRNSGSCGQTLHLPEEFPDEPFEEEPFALLEGDQTICRDVPVTRWRVKPVNVYPPDYKDMCNYCLYEFEQWWCRNHPEGPHFDRYTGPK